jgi:hypothetical protein
MSKQSPNVFYWNTADDKKHTHKRIEWVQNNGYLVCINININEKLFNKVQIGDIILTYEPKHHKLSKHQNGEDGYCMTCKIQNTDGAQAFTHVFTVTDKPIIFRNLDDEYNYNSDICKNWYANEKHLETPITYDSYFTEYYSKNKLKYAFPVTFIKKLTNPISTNKKEQDESKPMYYGPVLKGFDIVNKSLIINNKNNELQITN